jgi:hypothetical protein
VEDRRAGSRIDIFARRAEAMLLIEAYGTRIILVDVQIETRLRDASRFREQNFGDPASLPLGRDDDLIEVSGIRI